MSNKPIGIIDSGVGGLTVWREIVKELPHESIIYVADSKNTPYGARSPDEIYSLSKKLVSFLIKKRAKAIVIACNTITVSCLDKLRKDYPEIPLIGTVPVIKKAAEYSKNKKIGIFSTTRTAESKYQKELIKKFAKGCEVVSVGSDDLVPLIENGEIEGQKIGEVLRKNLDPFQKAEVDTVCLGCTHFPFVAKEIKKVLGRKVILLEPGSAIARHTKNILERNRQLVDSKNEPKYSFYTTGEGLRFNRVAKSLLHDTIQADSIEI